MKYKYIYISIINSKKSFGYNLSSLTIDLFIRIKSYWHFLVAFILTAILN